MRSLPVVSGMPGTPRCAELDGAAVAERAMRPWIVIVGAPSADEFAGLGERLERLLVLALAA